MLKVPQSSRFDSRISALLGMLPWGAVWGTIAGLVIGMGINLNIGFFYDRSSTVAMYAVATVCSVLGGFLGHVISSLYEENVVLMGHDADSFRQTAAAPFAINQAPVEAVLHTELRQKGEKHRVIGSHASIGAIHAPRADYPADEIDTMLRHLVAQAGAGDEARARRRG